MQSLDSSPAPVQPKDGEQVLCCEHAFLTAQTQHWIYYDPPVKVDGKSAVVSCVLPASMRFLVLCSMCLLSHKIDPLQAATTCNVVRGAVIREGSDPRGVAAELEGGGEMIWSVVLGIFLGWLVGFVSSRIYRQIWRQPWASSEMKVEASVPARALVDPMMFFLEVGADGFNAYRVAPLEGGALVPCELFAASSSVSTFLKVMEDIANSKQEPGAKRVRFTVLETGSVPG